MLSRSRERMSTQTFVGSDVIHSPPGYPTDAQTDRPFSDFTVDKSELIIDDNHTKRYGHTWGDCVHAKWEQRIGGDWTSAFVTGGGLISFTGPAYVTGVSPPEFSSVYPQKLFDAAAADADNLCKQVVTQIHESFSLLNDLLEIEDLKEIIPKFESVVQYLRDLLLSWEFGIKPTYQDVVKILGPAFTDTLQRIEFLRKNNGKVVTKRKSSSVEVDAPDFSEFLYENSVRSGLVSTLAAYSCNANYTLTVKAKLNLSGLDGLYATVDAFATALGLTNMVKVAWNAIPYSFVLEWFVNISSFLDNFRENPFKGSIDIVDAWCTSKVGVLYDLYQIRDLAHDPAELDPYQTGTTVLISSFRRTKGLPIKGDLLTGSLSPLEELLLGALIHQRIPHL